MDTIGKFEVVEKIGEGGFGVVYLGLDPHIKRRVAIKCCTSEDLDIRERFFQEARISGNLHHRNVVTVYDFGLQDEVPYLVQEYLSGEDLDRKIKRKEYIPFPEKLHFLLQIARGLDYAHSQGVIHRDIKPANIRILEDGTVKIMDFGIAKLANQETGLTQTGMTLGTASYLAPEQIRGEAVDPRTDIFSYGALAYELLAFQRPFTGQHLSTVLYQILNEDPPPVSEVAPDCPFELAAVVARCLERAPSRRYPSCAELLEALTDILRQRRSLKDSAVGPLVADLTAAEVQRTRAMPTESPRQPAAAASQSSDEESELADFELGSPADDRYTPRSISAQQVGRRDGSHWGSWAAALAVVLTAAGAAWYLLGTPGWAPAPPEMTELAPSRVAEGFPPLSEEPFREGPAEGTGPGEIVGARNPPGGATEDSSGLEAPSTHGETPTLEEVEAVEPEDLPPPPPPTVLVVPRAWSPAVTVRVDGTQYRLDRELRLNLPPGRHTLQFALVEREYRDFQSLAVTVSEGEERRVAVPILPPGQLQVQPRIGTPAGEVFLDEERLGMVPPILERKVRPGQYTLRVRREGSEEALPYRVEVAPGRRTVATFDLSTDRWTVPPPRPMD